MAGRILFDMETDRKLKNWREPKPGDVCWYVPDPDEAGTIDPDQMFLVLLSNQPTEKPYQYWVSFLNKAESLRLINGDNLLLSVNADERDTLKGEIEWQTRS
jgi:hypothetical protein